MLSLSLLQSKQNKTAKNEQIKSNCGTSKTFFISCISVKKNFFLKNWNYFNLAGYSRQEWDLLIFSSF